MRSETEDSRAVDFVLMDYVMIRMNGHEAVQRMRSDLGYKGVVIGGITGNALPDGGYYGQLQKPWGGCGAYKTAHECESHGSDDNGTGRLQSDNGHGVSKCKYKWSVLMVCHRARVDSP